MSDEFSVEEVARYWDGYAEAWAEQVRRGADVAREWLDNPAFLAFVGGAGGVCSTPGAAKATTRASSRAAAPE